MNSYHDLSDLHLIHDKRDGRSVKHKRLFSPIALLASLILGALALLPSSTADPVAELSIQTSANVLRAGANNTVILKVLGIGKLVSNLDVSLALPEPLVLFGDNHWRRSSFGPGVSIDIALFIFAPASAAGNSYQATITGVYKEAGETTYSQESHTIGFLVRGWIDLVIYDLSVTPVPAGPGSTVTISGSLLNRGITAAMFTNLTIEPAHPLIISTQSISYLGQVDPNAPAPFSLSADIESTAADGRYQVTLIAYYQDDLHMNQQSETSTAIEISSTAITTQTTPRPTGPIGVLSSYVDYLLGIAVIVVVVLIVLRMRRRRRHNTSK